MSPLQNGVTVSLCMTHVPQVCTTLCEFPINGTVHQRPSLTYYRGDTGEIWRRGWRAGTPETGKWAQGMEGEQRFGIDEVPGRVSDGEEDFSEEPYGHKVKEAVGMVEMDIYLATLSHRGSLPLVRQRRLGAHQQRWATQWVDCGRRNMAGTVAGSFHDSR